MGEYRVERATARGLAVFDRDRNPNAPAVKPRSRGGCPGGGGLEGSGRSRAGGLRSATEGVELDEVALRARCLQRLARFKVPKRIVAENSRKSFFQQFRCVGQRSAGL